MTDILVDLLAEDTVDFNSSSIDYVAYDRESKTLYVEFQSSGTVYAYEGVEESTYNLFVTAPSLNTFWRNHISGEYTSAKSEDVLVKREVEDTFDGSFDGQKWPNGVNPVTGEDDAAETLVTEGEFDTIRITNGGIFFDSALTLSVIKPTRFGVKYTVEAVDSIEGSAPMPSGPFEPQYEAMSEADALAQFNAAILSMEKVTGWTLNTKIVSVTHYFD